MLAIEVQDLKKRYDDVPVVDGVSFTVEKGEIFVIVGPNGAGKTTTVESIAGLRRPDEGQVRVMGLDPWRDEAEMRRILGVQLQESRLPDRLRVGEALELYSSCYDSPLRWEDLLAQLGLVDKRESRFGDLSGGQKQRLSIALALVGNPQVVILDELTTGLDPHARRATWRVVEQLKERGVTVVLVTHFMEEAERLADRVALIDLGKVVAIDTPARLISSTDNEQVIRFRPSRPIDEAVFVGLPGVTDVGLRGDQVVVSGVDNVLHAVTSTLMQHAVVPYELRMDRATLDDAFLALTGRTFTTTSEEA